MVLNFIQKLCFIISFLLPFLTAYRPALETFTFSDENRNDNHNHDDTIIESEQNNQFDPQLSIPISISPFDTVLIICIFIYIIYLFYKRRLTIRAALQILSNRFPRLTPLLIIAHLVHQEVSRNDDPENVDSHQHPETNRSSISLQPPTHLMAVDTIEDLYESSENSHLEEEQNIYITEERVVWYDCRPSEMAQDEERIQHLDANQQNDADRKENTPTSCSSLFKEE